MRAEEEKAKIKITAERVYQCVLRVFDSEEVITALA